MRFENPICGAAYYRAAVGTHFVEPRPSRDVPKSFHAAHPREESGPYFVLKKWLAVVPEMVTGRLFGRGIASQDVRTLVVKIDPRGVDDHAVVIEIGGPVVYHADLPPHRFAVLLEPKQLQRLRRPGHDADVQPVVAQRQR